MEYLLIEWPDSQSLMKYPWFQDECFLALGKEDITGSSAYFAPIYFVPKHRICELEDSPVPEIPHHEIDAQEIMEREEAKAYQESLEDCPMCRRHTFDGISCFHCRYILNDDDEDYYEQGPTMV